MALEGTLNYLDIAHLLQVLGSSKKSGVLEISWKDREAKLFFHSGRLIRAETNRFHDGIGTLLVREQLLPSDKLDEALALQQSEGNKRRLGALLCDEYGIRSGDIERVLRGQYERTVYDVFSWPGGSFVFHFQEPEAVLDRFHLNPVEFILQVGIQAGLLADEGVERQQQSGQKVPLIFLVEDGDILQRCCDHWGRKGHQVRCCERVEEVLGHVLALKQGESRPVVVTDLVCPRGDDQGLLGGLEVLDAVQALRPDVPVVVLGDSADPKARIAAQSHGARAYVKKPTPEDRDGPQGETHFDVFLISLEKSVEKAIAGSVADRGEARV